MSFIAAAGAVVGVAGGIGKLIGANKAKKKAQERQRKAKKEMDARKKQYEQMDTSNLAKDMTNKMENLTINQKGAQMTAQKSEQSRANIMDKMGAAAGGSGIAALAQTMANQGSQDAQKAGAMIGDQEAANQKATATEASNVQNAKIKGAETARTKENAKRSNLLQMAKGEHDAAAQGVAQAQAAKSSAISGIAGSVLGGLSDRRAKKNINKIGVSQSGLNIYSFEYRNPLHGGGLFQGVMSDEIPQEAVISTSGYDHVDYSVLDVEFKQL
jgi:hypothetical protein